MNILMHILACYLAGFMILATSDEDAKKAVYWFAKVPAYLFIFFELITLFMYFGK